MNAIVTERKWPFSKGYVRTRIIGVEANLLMYLPQQKNMSSKIGLEKIVDTLDNEIGCIVSKKFYIVISGFGSNFLYLPYFDSTNIYFT